MNTEIRVRFAPSPTGHLHIGGLRTAIFNWLFARHHRGIFLVRIEDTDLERSKQEYTDSILQAFSWMGIASDEPIIIQSQRLEQHTLLIEKLLHEGRAYRCFCTQEEVTQRYQAQVATDDEFVKYDRKCATRASQPNDATHPHVIRFKLPTDRSEVLFHDLIRGDISIPMDQLDDFIIARSDGRPMYNFVVVADDAYSRITHIIRGEDHISNTPKQILLYEALGYVVPQFAHLPMILGASGQRLSKRDAATSVLDYRSGGFLADALFNYLVRLGWAYGDREIFSREELIAVFSLDQVNKKAAVFDMVKLLWLNGEYIKATASTHLLELVEKDIDSTFQQQMPDWSRDQLLRNIELYKDRVQTLKELVQEIVALYRRPSEYNSDDVQKWITHETPEHLRQIIEMLEALEVFSVDLITEAIKTQCKQLNIKLSQVGQPIRIALLGNSSGPSFFALLAALGKEESVRRLRQLLTFLERH